MITWIVLFASGTLLGIVFRRAGHAPDAEPPTDSRRAEILA
jgi:hypothetical protein